MNNPFVTGYLALAAYLVHQGHICTGLVESVRKPGFKDFEFTRFQGIEDEVRAFNNNEAQVDPKKYYECLRELRNMLHPKEV